MNTENFSAVAGEGAAVVGLAVPAGSGAGEIWRTLAHTEEMLGRFGLAAERWEPDVVPAGDAHRRHLVERAARGWRAVIVGSPDGALPGALAGAGTLPVIRVPVAAEAGAGNAADALKLLWPEPEENGPTAAFATVAIGEAGAKNAALLVVSMLALGDAGLRQALEVFRRDQTAAVLASALPAET